MRFFIDTEFLDKQETIDLISIALVDETGRHLYAINKDFDQSTATPWLQENVISRLEPPETHPELYHSQADIRHLITGFTAGVRAEFWGWKCAYDWVLLNMLYGSMMDHPKNFPVYCYDIHQLWAMLNFPEIPETNPDTKHNALVDAHWARRVFVVVEEERKRLFPSLTTPA